ALSRTSKLLPVVTTIANTDEVGTFEGCMPYVSSAGLQPARSVPPAGFDSGTSPVECPLDRRFHVRVMRCEDHHVVGALLGEVYDIQRNENIDALLARTLLTPRLSPVRWVSQRPGRDRNPRVPRPVSRLTLVGAVQPGLVLVAGPTPVDLHCLELGVLLLGDLLALRPHLDHSLGECHRINQGVFGVCAWRREDVACGQVDVLVVDQHDYGGSGGVGHWSTVPDLRRKCPPVPENGGLQHIQATYTALTLSRA